MSMSTTTLGKRSARLLELTPSPPSKQDKNDTIAPSLPRRRLSSKSSRTNDDVHSSIDICPVTKVLLDSRPMQRLRGIQQLATAQYVYVNCTHNRLEHSLGVAHLAEQLARRIARRQPQLKCTPKDILCAKLAGLMHDVGHGPFSHTYEDFLHTALPEYLKRHPELQRNYEGVPDIPENYRHESTSLMLVDAALESRGLAINLERLDEPLEEIEGGLYPIAARSMRVFDDQTAADANSILTSRDFVFIQECINGKPIPHFNRKLGIPEHQFVGRPERHQEWLYDIVSNRHSGLDVDKIDYFARDHRAAMKGSGETDKLMILEAVVAWGKCTTADGKCSGCNGKHLMICYPKKLVGAAMNFFKQRHYLHKTIYRHKKNDAVGHMICDVLCHADPFFHLSLPSGQRLPISRAMLHVEAFLRLRDSILDAIANTPDERLEKAKRLIRRLEDGDLYKCVAEKNINMTDEIHQEMWREEEGSRSKRAEQIKEELLQVAGQHDKGICLTVEDIIVECVEIHCGQKKNNPLSRMRFLSKEQLSKLDTDLIDNLPEAHVEDENNYQAALPRIFCENSIRLFCRTPAKAELATHVFSQWLEEKTSAHCQTTPLRAGSRLERTTMISPVPLFGQGGSE